MRDPHEILGVPWNADPRHIRAAYKKRAAELHPDRNPAGDAADRLKEVIEAYRFLSNPSRFVRQQDEYQAPARGGAASVSVPEFRRQQTFWYHFQKLISPKRSRFHPSHATRATIAITLCMSAIGFFVYLCTVSPPIPWPNSLGVVGLFVAPTIGIVVPSVFAEIPLYTPRRGLEPTVPDWLIETYGWMGLLAMIAILLAMSGIFG